MRSGSNMRFQIFGSISAAILLVATPWFAFVMLGDMDFWVLEPSPSFPPPPQSLSLSSVVSSCFVASPLVYLMHCHDTLYN